MVPRTEGSPSLITAVLKQGDVPTVRLCLQDVGHCANILVLTTRAGRRPAQCLLRYFV